MNQAILKIIILGALLILGSCAKTKELFSSDDGKVAFEDRITSNVTPKWFAKTPERFILKNTDNEIASHMFFDVNPNINIKSQTVNFVIETPARSDNQYLVDLKSGRHYFNQRYCSEKDHSTKSSINVKSPPFHIGFIPRVYDQLGTPQKIFVFDDEDEPNFKDRFYNAKVVGGFVYRECTSRTCTRETDWDSRLALIGINTQSKKYKKISSVNQLKKEVDWPEVEAFFRNGFGNNIVGEKVFSSFKIGSMLTSQKVLEYFKDNSLFFTIDKMTTLKRSCYKLYDQIWQELGSDTPLEAKLRSAKSLKEQAQAMSKIKKDKSILFDRRFKKAFRKYNKNYLNCEELVYPANINENPNRLWFFSFYSMINLLYEEQYTYNCSRNIWVKESFISRDKKSSRIESAFFDCSIRDIEKSFGAAKVLLQNLRHKDFASYRFIDYDNTSYGTHNKIYSWVPISNKRFQCANEKVFFKAVDLFPKDVDLPQRDFDSLNQNKVIF